MIFLSIIIHTLIQVNMYIMEYEKVEFSVM